MSKMLSKMNLISVVQQLPKEDIETIQSYVEMIEEKNQELELELSGYRQAILNNKEMLGLKEKNQELKKQNQVLKKQLEERKYYKFYKYENNPNGSDYCFCERPCDSNMSLICFFENGELCGFMSETLVSNHDDIKEISLNEFAHKFIKPSINANFQNKKQQTKFIKYLEDKIKICEEIINSSNNDFISNIRDFENKKYLFEKTLQKYKETIGVSDDKK